MQIAIYKKNNKEEWDNLVRESRNGTFLHYRDFMEYHADRFTDSSFLFYDKNKLVAALPGNINEDIFYSHQGLTYGGLILSNEVKTAAVTGIFSLLLDYLKEININKVIYKATPHIYHKYPVEEDLYVLFRLNAELSVRSISSAIYQPNLTSYNELRKRQIKKAKNQGYDTVKKELFSGFWEILKENLNIKHHTYPVHSLQEIEYLKSKFPDNIHLFCVEKESHILAGCVVFETDCVAHIQYISSNEEGKKNGALDLLFDYLIKEEFCHKKYFDFGISTENNGRHLNEGLISQKEGFGARGIVYDTYSLNI